VRALCREMELRAEYLPQGERIRTVYLGGGTPSLLQEEDLRELFLYINKVYGERLMPWEEMEITLEANPDDLTQEYISMLRNFPINRISMGVQTFHDRRLQLLNRRHTAEQAVRAVAECRRAGITNLSIDLIYGLPEETPEEWQEDLNRAMELQPPHLSAYHLTYEEGTVLYRMREAHRVTEVSEETSTRFFRMLRDTLLAHGYEHYEISNFALPGMRARHNSSYWDATPYLGLGAAAHSYDGVSRQWNPRSLTEYVEGIKQGAPVFERETLSPTERYDDYIITALRTCEGISLPHIAQVWGEEMRTYCLRCAQRHLRAGHLAVTGERLHLTPEGIFLSDGIMTDLLSEPE
jgi:oxygen-independent coproporphyrinogen-3 oxidase